MPENINPYSEQFLDKWSENTRYFQMLAIVSKLSRLFSLNSTPYIDYRLVENLFCKYYKAINDARLCTAYDARIGSIGVGIKTFILTGQHKIEKVAEFNKLKRELDECYSKEELARRLAEYRNDRIDFSRRSYNISHSIYHIVGRSAGQLELFNYPYDPILVDEIGSVKRTRSGLTFSDGRHDYSFNSSKSVLMMKFIPPEDRVSLPVEILDDPFALLEQLLYETPESIAVNSCTRPIIKGEDYVILPLYSERGGVKQVPLRSGLNQWNAKGRPRNPDEVYIPIPRAVHYAYPNFFPDRDTPFLLHLPTGEELSAKVCQDNSKALMSNPNQALGRWLLRDMLQLDEGQLVTMEVLNKYGIDSVMISRLSARNVDEGADSKVPAYSLSFQSGDYESYETFIGRDDE